MSHEDESTPTVANLAGALGKMVREAMAEIRPRLVGAALTATAGSRTPPADLRTGVDDLRVHKHDELDHR